VYVGNPPRLKRALGKLDVNWRFCGESLKRVGAGESVIAETLWSEIGSAWRTVYRTVYDLCGIIHSFQRSHTGVLIDGSLRRPIAFVR
jgi:hypothetical protein